MSYSRFLARVGVPSPKSLDDESIRADFSGAPDNEAELLNHLRVQTQQWLARIIQAEFEQAQPLSIIGRALTVLAEAAMDQSIRFYRQAMSERFGHPRDAEGQRIEFCVLGMGKMGGYELNLASDIDLIYFYAGDGQTDGRSQVSAQEYFDRLAKKITPALDRLTAMGRVFRVDLRLRPWGGAGPMAMSHDAMVAYYEQHGRPWERMAMLRARPIAGDLALGYQFLREIRPFVYRRYLDFGALESLRELKVQIREEAGKKDWENDIKRGSGGIREAEFIVQVEQLIHGGRRMELQTQSWLRAIEALKDDLGIDAAQLIADYEFLRHVEHAIQAFDLEQTHRLPSTEEAQQALCLALKIADYPTLYAQVEATRARIRASFEQVVAGESPANEARIDVPEWLQAVKQLKAGLNHLDDTSRARLNHFLEIAGGEVGQREDLEVLAPRLMALTAKVARRSAYLALLNESLNARTLLYRLLSASQWITDQLCDMPALMDELLDVRQLLAPPDRTEIAQELISRLHRVNDEEQRFNRLREFKAAHVLRTAATELLGERAINHASDHLTWVAESILKMACAQAHEHVQARHGCPLDRAGQRTAQGVGIIGYGKLGGIELSYGSDLDLVFVHRLDDHASTDGDKPISGQQYLQRWVRHFLQILNVRTTSGVLYEIDTRLRPSGNKGLMVVSLSGYQKYLESQAWTWERQALVRARPIAGDPHALDEFSQIRHQVLIHPRDVAALRDDVIGMREKMRAHLSQTDIKHASGGVVDLEFIVQYLTLRDAPSCPALTQWSDNLRLLETLAAHKAMPDSQARALIDAYLRLRTAQHRQALGAPIDSANLADAQDTVRSAWKQWLGDNNTNEA